MKSTIKKLNLDDFTLSPESQRVEGVDEGRAAKIAAGLMPAALGIITVVQRDGQYVVIDGNHRITALRLAGYKGTITASVVSDITPAEEAGLFIILNDFRAPSAISKFIKRQVWREPTAVAISEILAAHGWVVRIRSTPGSVTAVDALDRVYRNAGGALKEGEHHDLTDRVVGLVTAAWEHDTRAVDAPMLLALAQLIGRFGPSLDDKKLVNEMQATRPGVLIGRARALREAQGGTLPAALAKILAALHNKGRRTNLLPDWVWVR